MKSTPHAEDSAVYVITAAMQDAADDENFEESDAFVADFKYDISRKLPCEIETTEEADALYNAAYDAARQLTSEIADAKRGVY